MNKSTTLSVAPGAATREEQTELRWTLQRGVALQQAGVAELRLIAALEYARALKTRLQHDRLDEAELLTAQAEARGLVLATAEMGERLGVYDRFDFIPAGQTEEDA